MTALFCLGDAGGGLRGGALVLGLDAGDEVLSFAEAGGGDAFVLFVTEGDGAAGEVDELLGDGWVADGKLEDLGRDAGLGGHDDLTFPGLADPAFVGDFLEVAGALAGGIGVVERDPGPGGEAEAGGEDEAEEDEQELARAGRHIDIIVAQNVLGLESGDWAR